MWALHDDDLPAGVAAFLPDGDPIPGEEFDPEWELEAMLDARSADGLVDPQVVRSLVAELDEAHDLLVAGDGAAADRLRGVLEGIGRLVESGRLEASDVDAVVSLAQAALDMAEANGVERVPGNQQ